MKVLFSTDGSKQSKAASETLGKLALAEGDELKVISVVDMAVPLAIDIYGGYLPDTADLEKAARENAARILQETTEQLKTYDHADKVNISTEILFGSPDSRIVEAAEQWPADLIVIGSHGYSRWERILLGSVSDSVIHHAPCS